MSYAGTYGADEECPHGTWRPNCWRCNGAVERFARELPERERHVAALSAAPTLRKRVVVTYDATCPGCGWARNFPSPEAAQAAYDEHAALARRTLAEWWDDEDVVAEVRARRLV